MSKWKVTGKVTVYVTAIVDADDEDEAFDAAADEIEMLESYCGNGGTDKLIGVSSENLSVESSDIVEWDEAEPADESESPDA